MRKHGLRPPFTLPDFPVSSLLSSLWFLTLTRDLFFCLATLLNRIDLRRFKVVDCPACLFQSGLCQTVAGYDGANSSVESARMPKRGGGKKKSVGMNSWRISQFPHLHDFHVLDQPLDLARACQRSPKIITKRKSTQRLDLLFREPWVYALLLDKVAGTDHLFRNHGPASYCARIL